MSIYFFIFFYFFYIKNYLDNRHQLGSHISMKYILEIIGKIILILACLLAVPLILASVVILIAAYLWIAGYCVLYTADLLLSTNPPIDKTIINCCVVGLCVSLLFPIFSRE